MPDACIRLVERALPELVEPLSDLLIDAVESGASVGFLAPLSREAAQQYWRQVLGSVGEGLRVWVADLGGEVVGSVQLALCERENGVHRAEVQKLFVLRSSRGRGLARRLMEEAEAYARRDGRTLLVLDTEAGSDAETVYRRLGWTRVGEIPQYAASPDGTLHATAYYYKRVMA